MEETREKRKKILLDLISDSLYTPMKKKELASFLQIPREDREEFDGILEELLLEGKIVMTLRGKYMKANGHVMTGIFQGSSKGFGFVTVEGKEEDFFIPPDKIHGAFHQDVVEISLLPKKKGKRQEAQVLKILERGIKNLVGTFRKSGNFGFVIPDNTKVSSDIFIGKENFGGAADGQKVIVGLTDYGNEKKSPEGKVTEIIGYRDDPGVDVMSVIRGFDIPTEFPDKVLNQAERLPFEVTDADRAGRLDLRNLLTVTIDGEDAKDLDDAVSVYREGEIYHLGVHIADVSNYVQENSALDREALKRGTSVYLVDRVIPMLPRRLSNGICSLNKGEDRLTLSCLMDINEKGEIIDYKIAESVIRVSERMSYTAVREILEDENPERIREYESLVPMFREMEKLASILRMRRRERGSIDFDFPESRIILDESGKPVEIKPYERNTATRIIEDFMLIANETVAQHFYWTEIPFLYRTHGSPDAEKIQKLNTFVQNFGYYLKFMKKTDSRISEEMIHPREIQKLMDKIADTPEEALISRLTLRSMKRAQYTTECTGHFGLACPYYCHFTSPIRRYPDLQIHRIIKEHLRGRMTGERMEHYAAILTQVAKQTSDLERRADDAERETDKLKKAEFMESHIGEVYDGVISGITSWGIYVELPDTVEGLIHISKLEGDYFYYREETYEMVGGSTGKTYKLGEPVKIKVDGTDRYSKTVDFSLVEENTEKSENGDGIQTGRERRWRKKRR